MSNKLYPNLYFKNVTLITMDILKQNNIKGLILDVDNTLIDFEKKSVDGLEDWVSDLKRNEIKFCILSNSNNKEKVEKVGEYLNIPYIYFAKKPLKSGFIKAKKVLELSSDNIAVVGDQIFTDVVGGNLTGMFTILVEPLGKQDILITLIKRPIERLVVKKYLKGRKNDNK